MAFRPISSDAHAPAAAGRKPAVSMETMTAPHQAASRLILMASSTAGALLTPD